MTPFDPEQHYLHLAPDGTGRLAPGGEAFWAQPPEALAAFDAGWLISEYRFDADWPSWERHPHGDELVYLLEGEATLVLQTPEGERELRLQGRAAVRVPRGTWHTARVATPSRMLFVTRGEGTEHRAVEDA